MSGDIDIRDYRASDQPAVLALISTTLTELGFSPDMGGVTADLATIAVRYSAPSGAFFVAEREGQIVGTVAIRAKEGATCELKRLYVASSARQRGLGQSLYVRAEAFARAAGYRCIWLDSSRRFAQARKLYERNGFVLVAELDNDWEDNVYEKRLSPQREG